ncbi:hypothetical protein HMH01_06435 [Halovulum dunhuangense]|uniref:Uncharacterized protein n=1 Tax=Halovulum dunhuangense TaxID=1505036 RepID=A0A849L1E9_9RHOB|nr:hypothetical protein [Halovulum dunhuangense]NNU80071.1 hypothetical protein [Halovulum dunhuangense]
MKDEPTRPTEWPMRWIVALGVGALQNAIAVFAVYSSGQDVLSDGACIGGVFGTMANSAIIAVVLVWAMILAVKSFRETDWHPYLRPLLAVALSSATAIFIGLEAALHCTV